MDAMGLDFDQIAEDAVNEVFGRRGPVGRAVARHPVRAFRATHPGLAARRDHLRAGWGTPGWAAESYAPEYIEPYYEDEVPEEDELLEDEEGYGEYDPQHWHQRRGGPVVVVEEEYGRRGGGGGGRGGGRGRHPVRRAVRRQRKKRQERRETQRAGWGSPSWSAESMDAGREPLGADTGYPEEPYPPDEEYDEEYEVEDFGNDDERVSVPVQQPSTFRSALETGLGLGIGFMGVALGIQLIAQAVSGRR